MRQQSTTSPLPHRVWRTACDLIGLGCALALMASMPITDVHGAAPAAGPVHPASVSAPPR